MEKIELVDYLEDEIIYAFRCIQCSRYLFEDLLVSREKEKAQRGEKEET